MLPESANWQQPIIAVDHVHPAEEMSSKSDERGNTDQSERIFNYVRKNILTSCIAIFFVMYCNI